MAMLILSLLFVIFLLPFIEWKLRQPLKNRGPTSYPIIGCLVSFYKNRYRLLDWYTDMLSASPTQTITVSRFGARRTIVTANPENVEYMLKTNFSNFPKGKPFTELLGDFLGKGIFNVDGDLWYSQHKLVAQEFSSKSLRNYAETLLNDVMERKLLPVLKAVAMEVEKTVDLQDLLRRLAFDLVCKFSLGYDPCSLEYDSLGKSHPIIEAFDVASMMCALRGAAPLSIVWKVKRFFGIGTEKRLREAIDTIHLFIEGVIHEKKRAMEAKENIGNDMLSKLMVLQKDETLVRDTVISFVMAGRDTTSAAMTWLFYLLSCHPTAEDKLLNEIGFFHKHDNLLTYEDLRGLRFLKACICESMRLYPPVAWDSKHPISNDVLPDGTPVAAGDRVTYFPYGMGRMEALWGEDRLKFKPERWISHVDEGSIKALKNVSPYKFPVFQAGPRVCLGQDMAFVQMKYVVAAILKRYRIKPAREDRPVFVPLLTAHMAGGFPVFISPRHSSMVH